MAWSTITDSGGTAPPPVSAPGTGTGKGVAPVWSDKFVSSVGVATHFNYWDLLPYGNNVNSTIAAIKAGGFRFIRDGLSVDVNAGSNNRYWGVMKQLTSQGIKLVLVTQPAYLGNNQWVKAPYTNQSNLDTAVNRIGAAGILAFEGPNEVDNNNGSWGGIPAYGANTRAYMSAMYRHAKQIAPSISVIGLTTTSSYGSSFIGDISGSMDAGTLHPYPNGTLPASALLSTESNSGVLNAAHKPWWVTETGYYTAPHATTGVYQPGVSEAAQGKYVPRLYLDYFNAGIVHTSVYEIIDEHVSQADAEANYGLLRNDGSPKPAYTAMKNMLNLLADPGAAFTPSTPLDYSLTGATNTIRQALFQKRDGRFYLVLWNDVQVYNTSSKSDVSNSNVPVVVNFTTAPRSISKYQPMVGATGAARALPPIGPAFTGDSFLSDEEESLRWLEARGVPGVDRRSVDTLEEAVAAADRLGYPVVLKGRGRGIAHKTELGWVCTDVRSPDELRRLAHEMRSGSAGAHLEGFLVARRMTSGIELLVGLSHDPVWPRDHARRRRCRGRDQEGHRAVGSPAAARPSRSDGEPFAHLTALRRLARQPCNRPATPRGGIARDGLARSRW